MLNVRIDKVRRKKKARGGEMETQIVLRCETWKEPGLKRSYPKFSSDSWKSTVQILVC